ncbi:MAG: glycosyltransferase family 4 protein [Burkholderiaceae bacterium]|nr:glycosyltransferase family 4 protein [Burkholderiaceae bacterium]
MSTTLAMITSQAFSLVNFRGPLIAALVSRGTQVYALAPDYDDDLKQRVAALGAHPVDCSMARAGLNPLRDLGDLWRLSRLLRRLAPDATLAYFVKPVIYGSIAAWLAGVPDRYSLVAGLGFVFTDDSASRRPGRRLLRAVVAKLYRFALARNRRVILQNQDDLHTLASSGILDPRKAVLIRGTGVDLDHYGLAPVVRSPPVFLLVARMLREKGVHDFVAAARLLKARHPQARLILVGGTDPNPGSVAAAELESWAQEGMVEWVGQVDDVRPWMARASVFVLPSYYREGVPRGNQEAMAMGRPIVTTDWVGCRETVEDGVNGFMVPVRDPVALARAMSRFIENPDLIETMGLAGRRMAEERFDVHDINRRIVEVLQP